MSVDAEGHRIAKERAESGDWASPIRWRPIPGGPENLSLLEPMRLGDAATIGSCMAMRAGDAAAGWALHRYEGNGRWRQVSGIEYPPENGARVELSDHDGGGVWRWVPAPSRRRRRALIVLRRDRAYVWAIVPGWDPKLQILVWVDDSSPRLIPEEVAGAVVDGHVLLIHASLNIGAEGPYALDFEGIDDWDLDGAKSSRMLALAVLLMTKDGRLKNEMPL